MAFILQMRELRQSREVIIQDVTKLGPKGPVSFSYTSGSHIYMGLSLS